MPGEKAKNFGRTMKTLSGYLKPHKFKLTAVFVFAIASTVFSIISPTILGDATDKGGGRSDGRHGHRFCRTCFRY